LYLKGAKINKSDRLLGAQRMTKEKLMNITKIAALMVKKTAIALVLILTVSACKSIAAGEGIICYGDSLTDGQGVSRNKAYPAILQNMVSVPVINSGVSGDTTTMALYRLNRDVLSYDPKVVIINLGANDFLQQIANQQTDIGLTKYNYEIMLANLATENCKIYITRFLSENIMKEIMSYQGVPPQIQQEIIDNWDDLFSYLQTLPVKVEIIDDIWEGVWQVHMSDDLHPNAEGYKMMAGVYYDALKPYLEKNNMLKK
jgi:acyl-CoA thioesterase-1